MKVLASRAKDLDDVQGIVSATRGTLDVEQIRETLRLLEGALCSQSSSRSWPRGAEAAIAKLGGNRVGTKKRATLTKAQKQRRKRRK